MGNRILTKLHIELELSNRCNAECPECLRFRHGSTVKIPDLEPQDVSLEQYKQWLEPTTIARAEHIEFNGDLGDSMLAPDILAIVDYTLEHLPATSTFRIHTNGGCKNPDTWTALGKRLVQHPGAGVVFSIDGLWDTNHLYKRGVIWYRLEANVRAYTATGAWSRWNFLMFNHNKHQPDAARQLSKTWGVTEFRIEMPRRGLSELEHRTRGAYDHQGKLKHVIASTRRGFGLPPKEIELDMPAKIRDRNLDDLVKRAIVCGACTPERQTVSIDYRGNLFLCAYTRRIYNNWSNDWATDQLQLSLDPQKINLNRTDFHTSLEYSLELFAIRWSRPTYVNGKPIVCSRMCGV